MSRRVLVAGVGNIFLGDDAFGVEVAQRLAAAGNLPAGVEVKDFGIGGIHLAYQLLDGYDVLVLVDAHARGGAPGTLYVLEPERAGAGPAQQPDQPDQADEPMAALHDAHSMGPDTVLALIDNLGGRLGGGVERILVVGCEPAELAEGIGLSTRVAAAVPEAVRLVAELVRAECAPTPERR